MSKTSLLTLARRGLLHARTSGDGCSVYDVTPGTQVRQAVVALQAMQELDVRALADATHWTAQVLQGRVRVSDRRSRFVGMPGDLLAGSSITTALRAESDAVLLVTCVAGSPTTAQLDPTESTDRLSYEGDRRHAPASR